MQLRPRIYEFSFNGTHTIVNPREIIYAYSDNAHCVLVMRNGEKHRFRKKLDDLEEELQMIYPAFVRIAKSYLINCNYIKQYNSYCVTVKSGETLSVGGSHYKQWATRFQEWKGGVLV